MATKDKTVKEVKTLILPEWDHRKPKENYVPEGFESEEAFLKDMRENYELDIEADDDNRRAALEDKKFTAGEQWDPVVLEQRKGLPCLVINTVPQFVAQLVGDWRTNRIAVKVVPSENGDTDVAAVRSDLIRSIEQKSRAQRVYDDTFESTVQCGDGAFRIAVEYAGADVFDQDIMVRPIDDVLSVVWDRMAVDITARDAGHCFVDDLIPNKEFEARFKDASPSSLSAQDRRSMLSQGWVDQGAVRVTEYWRMIERDRLLVMFEDGAVYPFEEGEEDKIDGYIEQHGNPLKSRLAPCKYAQMHLTTGFKILAGPYEYKLSRLPIIRMSGRTVTIGDRKVRYGLVRFVKDAVRLRNFWRSMAAEQLGYAPKAQWIATEAAVEGREDMIRKSHLSRDPLIVVNDEAVIDSTIKRIDPPQMQMALLNEAQVNTQDMKDVTGIHDASLGIKSNETSGRAIMARQREGDVASLTYYDNGNAAILEAGDVINQLISQIYDGTRIVRIIGEDEQAKLVKINDPMNPESPNLATGNYDVTITTGASYTTRRVEAAEAMMEAVQVFPQMMQVAGDLVAKAQDWPGSEELAARLRKTVPQELLSDKEKAEQQDKPAQPDPQVMQMQAVIQEGQKVLEAQAEEIKNLKADKTVNLLKVKVDEFNAETNRIKVLGEMAAKDEEFNHRALEREVQHEMDLNKQEMDAKSDSSSSEPSTPASE